MDEKEIYVAKFYKDKGYYDVIFIEAKNKKEAAIKLKARMG